MKPERKKILRNGKEVSVIKYPDDENWQVEVKS